MCTVLLSSFFGPLLVSSAVAMYSSVLKCYYSNFSDSGRLGSVINY